MTQKQRLYQIKSEIRALYSQINVLKKEEAALLRARDVCQDVAATNITFDVANKNHEHTETVVRRCGITATQITGEVDVAEVSLYNVISGDVDDKFLKVNKVIENPETSNLFCIHLPIKTDGINHPMTTDIKHYIDHFFNYIGVSKQLIYSTSDQALCDTQMAISSVITKGAKDKIQSLFSMTEKVHASRVEAMLAMVYLWIINGNMMCARHQTRVAHSRSRFSHVDEKLWAEIDDEDSIRYEEMAKCRFCIIQRFYTMLFNAWKPELLIDSDDHVIEYLQRNLKEVDRAQVYYNVLFRTAAIHLVRMLLNVQLKDKTDKQILKFMRNTRFIPNEVKTSPNPDKATKILTLLAAKIDGSPLELASINYSKKKINRGDVPINKSKKLVLMVKQGDMKPEHVLEIMYVVYPEIFYRVNAANVRIVGCDVRRQNLMNQDVILSKVTVNEYVNTSYALHENVIFSSKYIPVETKERNVVDVITIVRGRDKNGDYTLCDDNGRFATIENFLSSLLMQKTGYKNVIHSSQDSESRSRYMFNANDKIKIGVINKNMEIMGNTKTFIMEMGNRVREVLTENCIWKHNGKALLATIILTYPLPNGSMQKNEFMIDLERV